MDHPQASAAVSVQEVKMITNNLRSKLHQNLNEYFSEEELRTLCFDMGVDYEGLPASGKAGKARELIIHLERLKRTAELIKQCRKQRPEISWRDTPGTSRSTVIAPPVVAPEQLPAECHKLKARYDAGTLSEAEFKARLEDMMVQDEQGRWWMIGYETGQWYVHDGEKWVRIEPPAAAPPATRPALRQPASESGVPTAEAGQSAVVISKLWLWAGAGILGVVLLALLILRIFPGALPIITPRPTLNAGSAQISDKDGMVMFYVPAGEFTMGSVDADSEADSNEKPQHKVYLGAFWIDRTEVTNAMFGRFVSATSYQTDAEKRGRSWVYNLSTKKWEETNGANWRHPRGPATDLSGLDSHPVVHVSWNDAVAYCRLAGRRLPTEAEWEKAARGMDSRKYPWGSQGVAGNLLNFADRNLDMYYADKNVDDGYRFTAPVGSYPAGASLYGALDMAGNVWEWMVSLWGRNEQTPEFRYPYNPTDGREDISASDTVLRVLRGGSWADAQKGVRATFRDKNTPHEAVDYIGFRCARSP